MKLGTDLSIKYKLILLIASIVGLTMLLAAATASYNIFQQNTSDNQQHLRDASHLINENIISLVEQYDDTFARFYSELEGWKLEILVDALTDKKSKEFIGNVVESKDLRTSLFQLSRNMGSRDYAFYESTPKSGHMQLRFQFQTGLPGLRIGNHAAVEDIYGFADIRKIKIAPVFPNKLDIFPQHQLYRHAKDSFLLLVYPVLRNPTVNNYANEPVVVADENLLGYFLVLIPLSDLPLLDRGLGVKNNLYDNRGNALMGDLPMPNLEQNHLDDTEALKILRDRSGEDYDCKLQAIGKDTTPLGYMTVSIPKSRTYARIIRTINPLLIMLALIGGVVLIVFIPFFRRIIANPIASLIHDIDMLSADGFDQNSRNIRIPTQGMGELKRLAESFQIMHRIVREKIADLKEVLKELRFNENNLAITLDSIGDGVIATDEQGKITRINPIAEKLTSWNKEAAIGRDLGDVFQIIDPKNREVSVIPVEHVIASGKITDPIASALLADREGNEPLITYNTALIRNDTTEVAGIVLTFRDISREHALQEELNYNNRMKAIELKKQVDKRTEELTQANKQLLYANEQALAAKESAEASNQAKSIFLANMSHELRTPLNAILGFSEMLARDPQANADQKEKLTIVNRSGAHLLAMINDVLDLSKIEAGRVELDPETFDLPQMLEDIGRMFEVRAERAGLRFDLDLDPVLDKFIKTDAGKLRQILINLLGNAVKFTKHGGFSLRARTLPMAEDPAMVTLQLEVEDSGPGIPAEQQEHIFKPFVQAGQSSSATKGTGLGLTISKSFVELMSGNMRVESSSGKGTLFFVDLPVILSSASEAVSIEAARPAVLGLEAGQTAWRILVVDDYPENRILLMTLLTEAGFEVREAENGKQAIALFRQWQPHFIWMDMRMPVMDGYEATTKIRLLPGGEEVKIVALTASAFKEQRNKIMASGCNEMVYKPFRVDDIFGSIQQHLGVRFIYEEEAGSVFSTTEQATDIGEATRMAALLPDPLFNDLKQAAINLDIEESYEALERIAETEPALANMLRACVDEMNFGTIQKVLKHE